MTLTTCKTCFYFTPCQKNKDQAMIKSIGIGTCSDPNLIETIYTTEYNVCEHWKKVELKVIIE
jgi:hypothetical protein